MSNKLYQAIKELSIYKWNEDSTIVDTNMKIQINKTFIGSPKYTTKTPDGKQIIYLFPLSYVLGEIDGTNPTYAAGISHICGGPTNANLYDRCWVEYDPKDVVDTKFLTKQDFPNLFKEIYIPHEDLAERSRVLARAEMAEIDEGRDDKVRSARAKLAAHAFMSFGPGNSTAQPQPARASFAHEDLAERSRVLALAEMAEIDDELTDTVRAARAKLAARAAPSFQDSRLPNEWETFYSRTDGKPYYRNRLTGDVTWDPPPPPGWEIHQSKTHGKPYYRNRLTGEVTWTRPTERARPLPSGWEAHQDQTTGKMYYRNLLSNKSQWERPLVAPFVMASGTSRADGLAVLAKGKLDKTKVITIWKDPPSPTASEIADFEMHMENLDLPSEYTPLPVPDNVMRGGSRIKSTNKKSLKKKRKSYRKSYKKSKSKRRTRKNTIRKIKKKN
jgi:hypothetical protein